MNYEEIISQSVRRLGYTGFENSLKADFRYALKWAESELSNYAKFEKRVHEFDIIEGTEEYPLPTDYNTPRQIQVLDSSGNELVQEEVEYATWLRWNPTIETDTSANDILPAILNVPGTVQDALLRSKIVTATLYSQNQWKIYIKPTYNGKVRLLYVPSNNVDVFDNLQSSPPFPEQYHHYIIHGVIKYIAEIEAGKAKAANDYNALQFYLRIQKDSDEKFKVAKAKTAEGSQPRSTFAKAKAFSWYENPKMTTRGSGRS